MVFHRNVLCCMTVKRELSSSTRVESSRYSFTLQ